MVPGLGEEVGTVSRVSMTVSVPPGKATAVGGEPGITKAVLSRIQVPSPWVGSASCVQETSRLTELVSEGCSGPPFQQDLNSSSVPRSLAMWC